VSMGLEVEQQQGPYPGAEGFQGLCHQHRSHKRLCGCWLDRRVGEDLRSAARPLSQRLPRLAGDQCETVRGRQRSAGHVSPAAGSGVRSHRAAGPG
jgi:hypothetical protein